MCPAPRPGPAAQPELDFRGAASKARQRRKRLKRDMARAERVRREGLRVRDVPCPHCGAPAFRSVKRGGEHDCSTPGGLRTHGRTLPGSQYHNARHEAAGRLKQEILDRGEQAWRELQSTDFREAP